MEKSTIREISSDFIAEAEDAQYYLRLVETGNGSAKQPLKRKFGVSRYWYCDKTKSWLPAKKGHVYLPTELWTPFQEALARTHYRVVGLFTDGNGHSSANGVSDKNPPTDAVAAATAVTDTAVCPAAAAAATTDVVAKRKRGRPPKCKRIEPADTAHHGRHECNAEESGPDSCDNDEAAQRGAAATNAAAEDPAHGEAVKRMQVTSTTNGVDGGYASGNCSTTITTTDTAV
jgi:hypothetical protein